MGALSFRAKTRIAREAAIIASVKRLLSDKGFDLMTVDEVAADVGIAKASLYKHFASKDLLATAAMVQTLHLALEQTEALQAQVGTTAVERLRAITRWTLHTQLAGQMPSLPTQNSSLRATLLADQAYTDGVMSLSDTLGGWIVQAQADAAINPKLPPELVLFTLYSRGCDPVLGFLKAGGTHSDAQIVDWVMATCFEGLAQRG